MHGGRVSPTPAVRPATGTIRPDERPVSVQVLSPDLPRSTGPPEKLPSRCDGSTAGCLRCRRRRRRVWPTGLQRLLPAHGSPPPRGRRCSAGSPWVPTSHPCGLSVLPHYALMVRPVGTSQAGIV